MKTITDYHKKEIKRINESTLLIHWWNCGKKTLDFNGSVSDYLKRNKDISIKLSGYTDGETSRLIVKVKHEIGQMTINFKCYEYELAIQQIVFQRLSYMGDKAKFSFNNREFSNNFHR